jgi:hypothetical protein
MSNHLSTRRGRLIPAPDYVTSEPDDRGRRDKPGDDAFSCLSCPGRILQAQREGWDRAVPGRPDSRRRGSCARSGALTSAPAVFAGAVFAVARQDAKVLANVLEPGSDWIRVLLRLSTPVDGPLGGCCRHWGRLSGGRCRAAFSVCRRADRRSRRRCDSCDLNGGSLTAAALNGKLLRLLRHAFGQVAGRRSRGRLSPDHGRQSRRRGLGLSGCRPRDDFLRFGQHRIKGGAKGQWRQQQGSGVDPELYPIVLPGRLRPHGLNDPNYQCLAAPPRGCQPGLPSWTDRTWRCRDEARDWLKPIF